MRRRYVLPILLVMSLAGLGGTPAGAQQARAGVPAISLAVLHDSSIAYTKTFGVKNATTGDPADTETVFAGASFSKTVFAFVVMTVVDEGLLDLDRPLQEYVPRPLGSYEKWQDLRDDPRLATITARHVLSHATGFPNWRWFNEDRKLDFKFSPGEQFSYSGEGFHLLQFVVERLTGQGLAEMSQERVFAPFGMHRTSYVWPQRFASNVATPHDEEQQVLRFNERGEADAAGSIYTTASDYATFLAALLEGRGISPARLDDILSLQNPIRSRRMFGPQARQTTDANRSMDLSWGLGFGRFNTEHGRAIFHTGHDDGWENYTVVYVDRGIGIALLSNSANFESIAQAVVEKVIRDHGSPFEWLGYEPFER